MGVRMRMNKGQTGTRRSHHGVDGKRLSTCECGAVHQRHRACAECGKYRGKQAIDVVARAERQGRRLARKQGAAEAPVTAPVEAVKEDAAKAQQKAEKQEKASKKQDK